MVASVVRMKVCRSHRAPVCLVMRERIVKLICTHCAHVAAVFWPQFSFFLLFYCASSSHFCTFDANVLPIGLCITFSLQIVLLCFRDILPSSVKDAAAPIFAQVVRGVTNAKNAAGFVQFHVLAFVNFQKSFTQHIVGLNECIAS
jgi:hypothetical protein